MLYLTQNEKDYADKHIEPANLQDKWLQALRSKKYWNKKGKDGTLKNHRQKTYCALGVLIDITPHPYGKSRNFSFVDDYVLYASGLFDCVGTSRFTNPAQSKRLVPKNSIVYLNDVENKSFKEIEEYITSVGKDRYFYKKGRDTLKISIKKDENKLRGRKPEVNRV